MHEELAKVRGIFKRRMSTWHAAAFVVSGTIGAGVLGLPFAIAQVGIGIGIVYILILGVLTMVLNLMLGEVVSRSGKDFQMAGLAKEYMGSWAGYVMTGITYLMWIGIMLIYIVGIGETLVALFGGSSLMWSSIFFGAMAILVFIGLSIIKKVDFLLSIGILIIILVIVALSISHVNIAHVAHTDLAYLLLPYGVVLFAFSGISSIPEAHTLLRHKDKAFKRAIIIAGLINIIVYALFAYVVVGVTGSATTEVATIGLGQHIGSSMVIFGNLFAFFAMTTSFLMTVLAFRDSLSWDYKIPQGMATSLVLAIPMIIFLLGLRGFVAAIDIVGGVLVSAMMIMSILIYWRAKQCGHLEPSKYQLHHTAWLIIILLVAFTVGAVYSVLKIF